MLAEAAHRLGLEPLCFAARADDPGPRLCPGSVFGEICDASALSRFFRQVRCVVYENEFLPRKPLERALEGSGASLLPSAAVLERFQDKLTQKEALRAVGIPHAPAAVWEGQGDPAAWVSACLRTLGGRAVFKWSRLGYDGKGIWLVGDSLPATLERAAAFFRAGVRAGGRIYSEPWVEYRRELAMVGCRSVTGEFASYPLVESRQEGGVCRWVAGPATGLGVGVDVETAAKRDLRRLAEAEGLVGCFGVEFFETEKGELWVNEIAPRVHNTGHFTLDGAETSQFENHWRAALGWPLGGTRPSPSFAMLNLLGPEGFEGEAKPPVPDAHSRPHWYAKAQARPGRKLGHLNAVSAESGRAMELVAGLERAGRQWSKLQVGEGA